jgi:shikimate kinase
VGHLWLIGMMGTGKTTVGALVAQKLGFPFVDLDTEVMVATGKTIHDLFAEGEEVFRVAETEALAMAASGTPAVISTGGGAVLAQKNLNTMKDTGITVLLTASVATIVERIGHDENRPLAQSNEALTAIADLRMATYLAASDHAVDTEGKATESVVEEVLACVAM